MAKVGAGQIPVYIVSTHELVARELTRILKRERTLRPTAANGARSLSEVTAEVFLIDEASCRDPIEELLRQLHAMHSLAKTLVIAQRRTPQSLEQFGIGGWLPQSDIPERLIPTVLAVASGMFCRPMAESSCSIVSSSAGGAKLTTREHEAYGLIRRRYSNREIAQEMRVQPSTAKSYVSSVLRKTRAATRRDLALDQSARES